MAEVWSFSELWPDFRRGYGMDQVASLFHGLDKRVSILLATWGDSYAYMGVKLDRLCLVVINVENQSCE